MMKSILIRDLSICFVKLPACKFTYSVDWNNKPHRNLFKKKGNDTIYIAIENDIWLSETLITQKLWRAVMGSNPSGFMHDDKPVENISFNDIAIFMEKIRKETPFNFMLPTEKEFIYACLLNYDESLNANLNNYVWYNRNSNQQTQVVKSKAGGKINLFDLLGNLYHFLLADITPVSDNECVYKGACWATQDLWIDKDYSFKTSTNTKNSTIGFRLALH